MKLFTRAAKAPKPKKPITSLIAYFNGKSELSKNRIMKTYTYVYVDGMNTDRLMKKHNKERITGWTQYDSDSVVVWSKGKGAHLWVYTGFWKRNKPIKRIVMDEETVQKS